MFTGKHAELRSTELIELVASALHIPFQFCLLGVLSSPTAARMRMPAGRSARGQLLVGCLLINSCRLHHVYAQALARRLVTSGGQLLAGCLLLNSCRSNHIYAQALARRL